LNTRSMLDKSMLLSGDTADSGSLAALGSVIHKVTESGNYWGVVYRGAARVGTFPLTVSDNGDTATDCDKPPRQLDIDLTSLDGRSSQANADCGDKLTLRAGGNIVFTAMSGTGGYAVELLRREKDKPSVKVFDSRALGAGDLYIVHVMRPGLYFIRNLKGKGQTELTVEYPDPEKIRQRMDPFLVEFEDEEIVPNKIVIQPVQALMFDPKNESRIVIELKKADDRPAPVRTPIVTAPKARKKRAPAAAGQKTILRKIRFYG
jgi:hypothetical protein